MKTKLLLIALLISPLLWLNANATETEPNNTRATANGLALNGSNSGAISVAGDVDWWRIAINADGKLTVGIQSLSATCLYLQLYDVQGTIVLSTISNCGGAFSSLAVDGLAKGTYYAVVTSYYANQITGYNINNSFSAATPANDVEPNSTYAQAAALSLNASTTGHTGYYYNNQRDLADWYKLTTNADGRVQLNIASQNNNGAQNCVYLQLFDNNGTTLLANLSNCGGAASTVSVDGLAAGTYYISVTPYYSGQFATYTLTDSLFVPSAANDTEPNNSMATELPLAINSIVTGHTGYYYNNYRDTSDWYNVTTNADGRLQFTIQSNNNQGLQNCIYMQLMDANGTTEIANASNCGGAATVLSTDGLAAGVYHLIIRSYYTGQFEAYTLTDSLFIPTSANDTEPNDLFTQPLLLGQNDSAQGHTGYYNNGQRDPGDWYQVTTDTDGALQLSIQSNNSQGVQNCLYYQLFDGDGTTELINGSNCGGAFSGVTKDGLAAGTYYVFVRSYYGGQFETYTLKTNLLTYNPNDQEPNNRPYQSATMPANDTINGHTGFSNNGYTDATDWWKINYTGTGNLTISLSSIGTYVGASCIYIQVFKDTAGASISSGSNCGGYNDLNLTGLTKGYYYVKITPYYGGTFAAYKLAATFVQVSGVAISVLGYSSPSSCANINNGITLRCTGSRPPYTVQLYRFGVAYGSPRTVANNLTFQYTGLPLGAYKVVAYGDGSTGAAFSITSIISIMARPFNLSHPTVSSTGATAKWLKVSCAKYYTIQYRQTGTITFSSKVTKGNVDTFKIVGLIPNTTYEWHVSATDSANGQKTISKYSAFDTFTTASSFISRNENKPNDVKVGSGSNENILSVYPNPANSRFTVDYNNKTRQTQRLNASLIAITGKIVWTKFNQPQDAINDMQVDVSALPTGLYLLQLSNAETGALLQTTKVVVQKN